MIQNDLNEEVESEIKLLNLKFTSIKSAKNVVIYWYVTLKNLPENTSLDDRVSKIEQSNGSGPIDNLVGFQSFLLEEQYYNFWKTQFSLLLILYYGGWFLACLFFGIFGFWNLKQDDKLLAKEIRRLVRSAFFLFIIGYFGYEFLNLWTSNFLIEQFNFPESTGVISSIELSWGLIALTFSWVLIEKAVPVQEDQDLTI